MGTLNNQIATENNVKSGYTDYIDTITPNKCATVKRLLHGLCLSGAYPVYNSVYPNGINNKYNMKSGGYFSATNTTGFLNIKRQQSTGSIPSMTLAYEDPNAIVYSTATGYKTFDYDTAVSCFNSYYTVTISAKFTITSGYRTPTAVTSEDGVSPASLDIDNPEEDTETNTDGQEPTIQPFSVGPLPPCQINICARDYDVCSPDTIICQGQGEVCGCDGSYDICSCEGTYTSSYNMSLQTYTDILDYNVYMGDTNNWTKVISGYYEHSQKTRFSTVNFTVTIPIIHTFGITQTPTAAFGIKFVFSHYSATLAVDYTVKTPMMYVTVYNPSHKCVKYSDLPDLYTAYGKTVDSGSSSASVASTLGEFDEVPETE